jgi:hypothetical protein
MSKKMQELWDSAEEVTRRPKNGIETELETTPTILSLFAQTKMKFVKSLRKLPSPSL